MTTNIIIIPVPPDGYLISLPGCPHNHILPAPLVIGAYDLDGIELVDLTEDPHAHAWVGEQPANEEQAAMCVPRIAEYLSALEVEHG